MDPLVHTNGLRTAMKVMSTVFLDSQGVIYIDYLEKGKWKVLIRYENALTHISFTIFGPDIKVTCRA